ncbi:Mitochondrial peroxiredoxin PRX1 [Candida viswanathii]|uniref:Mitochondrial peroxiredoxin PRX1 n=1 Tax=Candida viswanathii TaxID=5486 RepID=A0A367YHW8_9ASCO|nr:Mitochondrial peroxiredoxin PRX1 [Candida viswanathii]
MPTLRLGSTAPDFEAQTTNGPVKFHEYIGDSWAILFSHPAARTPICSTELPAFAKLEPEFTKRGVKLLGLSVDPVEANSSWIDDMEDISGTRVKFPIISDSDRKVSTLYDMLDQQDATNVDTKGLPLTVRSVFIIDPSKKIRLILTYPASTGRNTAEVLRVVDSLQTGDKHTIATPINWVPGDDVVIPVSVSDEKAKTLFPKFRAIKPYLRLTPLGTESK